MKRYLLLFLPFSCLAAGNGPYPFSGGGGGAGSPAGAITNGTGGAGFGIPANSAALQPSNTFQLPSSFVVNSAAVNASDTNPGTMSLPMMSITNAFAKNNSNGISIYVAGGSYTNQSLVLNNNGRVTITGNTQSRPNFYYGQQILSSQWGIWFSNSLTHFVVWSNLLASTAFTTNFYSIEITNLFTPFGGGAAMIFEVGTPYGGLPVNTLIPVAWAAGKTNRMTDTPIYMTNSLASLSNCANASSAQNWFVTNNTVYVITSDGRTAKNIWLPSCTGADCLVSGGLNSIIDLRNVNVFFPFAAVNVTSPDLTVRGVFVEGSTAPSLLNGISASGTTTLAQNEIAAPSNGGYQVNVTSPINYNSPCYFLDEQNWIHDAGWHSTLTGGSVIARHIGTVCGFSIGSSGVFCDTAGSQSHYIDCWSISNAWFRGGGTGWNSDGGQPNAPNIVTLENCHAINDYCGVGLSGKCSFYAAGTGFFVNGSACCADTAGNGCYATIEGNCYGNAQAQYVSGNVTINGLTILGQFTAIGGVPSSTLTGSIIAGSATNDQTGRNIAAALNYSANALTNATFAGFNNVTGSVSITSGILTIQTGQTNVGTNLTTGQLTILNSAANAVTNFVATNVIYLSMFGNDATAQRNSPLFPAMSLTNAFALTQTNALNLIDATAPGVYHWSTNIFVKPNTYVKATSQTLFYFDGTNFVPGSVQPAGLIPAENFTIDGGFWGCTNLGWLECMILADSAITNAPTWSGDYTNIEIKNTVWLGDVDWYVVRNNRSSFANIHNNISMSPSRWDIIAELGNVSESTIVYNNVFRSVAGALSLATATSQTEAILLQGAKGTNIIYGNFIQVYGNTNVAGILATGNGGNSSTNFIGPNFYDIRSKANGSAVTVSSVQDLIGGSGNGVFCNYVTPGGENRNNTAGAMHWTVSQPMMILHDERSGGAVGSVGTTETVLFSNVVGSGCLQSLGDSIHAVYLGNFVNSTSTKRIRVYYNDNSGASDTLLFDSGALTVTALASWKLVIDEVLQSFSSQTVNYSIQLSDTGANLTSEVTVGNFTWNTGPPQPTVIKVTGTAAGIGAANNDVTGINAQVFLQPAP